MNPEQQYAYDHIIRGNSVILTGAAGTGKTYVLNKIIKWAHENKRDMGVCAMTGAAALLIGGRTLHSFLGIGLGAKPASELAAATRYKRKHICTKINKLALLIIDEVSMLSSELFDKICEYLQILRRNTKPFGGVQVIFCGDFAQIPPIEGEFCFKSAIWQAMNLEKITLQKQVRQANDPQFQDILSSLRWGICNQEIIDTLRATKSNVFKDGITPTTLYAKNVDVDTINQRYYQELTRRGAQEHRYNTKPANNTASKSWMVASKIPEFVTLCVGAQVMCTSNLPETTGIVNGSRGVVVELRASGPKVKFACGKTMVVEMIRKECEDSDDIFVMMLPLRLAWAITLHKSQGATLDAVKVNLGSSIFEYNMGYTGLSRVRDLSSVCIEEVLPNSFRTHPEVLEFYGQTAPAM